MCCVGQTEKTCTIHHTMTSKKQAKHTRKQINRCLHQINLFVDSAAKTKYTFEEAYEYVQRTEDDSLVSKRHNMQRSERLAKITDLFEMATTEEIKQFGLEFGREEIKQFGLEFGK